MECIHAEIRFFPCQNFQRPTGLEQLLTAINSISSANQKKLFLSETLRWFYYQTSTQRIRGETNAVKNSNDQLVMSNF
jgi:hypothetical protein